MAERPFISLEEIYKRKNMVTLWEKPIANDLYVVSREKESEIIYNALFQMNKKMFVIEGDYGSGKTFLAKCYAQKYGRDYPGGVSYCKNYFEFQNLIEKWTASGFPEKRHLVVADELARLNYSDFSTQKKFMSRFHALQVNSEYVDVLLLGNPVPEILAGQYPVIKVPSMSDVEIEHIILENNRFFDLNKSYLLRYWNLIIQQSKGNPRRAFNILEMLAQNRDSGQCKVETLSPIIDINGKPLNSKSKEYGQLKLELSCANDQVLQHLQRNPEELYRMTPREFELFTASLLERMGYEVTVTPQTRDGGVDIFAAKKEQIGSFLYLVQCKKQNPARPVGISVIRELYGVLQAERATFASVVTTSFFSKKAIEFQEEFRHQISLLDYQAIKKCLYNII